MARSLRLTEEQYQQLQQARGKPVLERLPVGSLTGQLDQQPGIRVIAKVDGDGMNKTERAFFHTLCADPTVKRVRFQALKFKIGKHCWYTPDFDLERLDGAREIWEVKGHWEEDARVKMKAAAALFPDWAWLACQGRVRKTEPTQWTVEVFFDPRGTPRPLVIFERRT